MDYLVSEKIKEVVITFENFQTFTFEGCLVNSLGVERSKLPWQGISSHEPCATYITLDKEVYRSPDILDRLCQHHDITWFDVVFKNGMSCKWPVPWEDDPRKEDENMLQHNNECVDGLTIYIEDYKVF